MEGGRTSRQGWGSFDDGLYRINSFPSDSFWVMLCHIIWLWNHDERYMTSLGTSWKPTMMWSPSPVWQSFPMWSKWPRYEDWILLRRDLWTCLSTFWIILIFLPLSFKSKLVCEEVNVDRFFPVLYPKVRSGVTAHQSFPSTIYLIVYRWKF